MAGWTRASRMLIGLIVAAAGFFAAPLQAEVIGNGVLVRPDGEPAEGADVIAVARADEDVLGRDASGRDLHGVTKADGRFAAWLRDPRLLAVAFVHPEGFAFVGAAKARSGEKIALEQWAMIEGQINPAIRQPGETVVAIWQAPGAAYRYEAEANVDKQGRFVLERLPAGRLCVARKLPYMETTVLSHAVWADTRPATVSRVDIGQDGATVKARLVMDDGSQVSPKEYKVWTNLLPYAGPPPAEAGQLQRLASKASRTEQYEAVKNHLTSEDGRPVREWKERLLQLYAASADRNGEIVFRGVAPGAYRLRVDVMAGGRISQMQIGDRVIEVKEGQVLELGDLVVKRKR